MNKKLLKEQTNLVKKFNKQFKVGDKVNFKSSASSESKEVTVKTEAWLQNENTAVVMFEEVRSYCSIEPMFVEYKE
jgi:hypothetical protein